MNKGYVILVGSVDETTCNDGFLNCANFSLATKKVYPTEEEAIQARTSLMADDLMIAKEIWDDEVYYNEVDDETYSPYTFEVGLLDKNDPKSDAYLDVYFNSDVTNETIYKIQEVEL